MKRIISLLLALVMMLSVFSVVATAAQVDYEQTQEGNVLNFDVNSAGWQNFNRIFCHIWEYGTESFFAWQSKAERCTDDDGDGVWTYDLDAKDIVLEDDVLYGVIFSNENGLQTYDLLLGSECIGDTVYCDGTVYDSLQDGPKYVMYAYWKNQDKNVYGPEMKITSTGNVVGACIPSTTTAYEMFVDFLVYRFENAQTYSGKTDQSIVDDIIGVIGLSGTDTKKAIAQSGVEVDWKLNSQDVVIDPSEGTDSQKVYIRVDNEDVYEAEVGDTFTYTFYLQCSEKVAALDATTYYDAEGLEFLPEVDEYGDTTGAEFPNVPTMVSNFNIDGEILYNFSKVKGVSLPVAEDGAPTDENVIFSGKFMVTGEPDATYDIYTDLILLGDPQNNKIVFGSELVDYSVTLVYDFELKLDGGLLGDVDGDGEITIVDATTIQMHLAELKTLTEEQLKCADTDKNGEVDILDATRIQMFLAEIIEEL